MTDLGLMGENGYDYLLINPNRSYGIFVCASHQHAEVTKIGRA